ncbi:coiled-coil domain-containing protein 39 [Dunaliella salina]|uniref:Coiled-coil domain-containing protein 39 n=1 Tax=Dunaliella salina TaxID=3046 RepID=A0ABQ7FYY2_DUNSA|nr:coiled-coil domain-containing protein 39 [Dunaliella salina]|eukprot:KAF5827559.1 coiled-coil domain-containing protein 39 [Dunaliella salina]
MAEPGSGYGFGSIPEEPQEEEEVSTLPAFANAENRRLDAAVRALEKQLDRVDGALEENQDRIGIMEEHLQNVQQELKYTQGRVESKTKEIETEKHLQALADRETGRLTKDIGKLMAERAELADKVAGLQASVYKANEKLDGFKLLMNWNQEEMEQWALAQRQKEEDNTAMDKYKKQDAAKVKELQQMLEKMSRAVVAKKADLEDEVVETQAAQIQLDKAAEDFRKLHNERQVLIRQWEDAMQAMNHRDKAIVLASEQFTARKAELRQRKAELDAQARFLESEGINNKEVDARIAFYDREMGKQRDLYLREMRKLDELSNQADEAHLKAVIKEAEDLKKDQFKRSQRLFELRTKERDMISEISGGQGQNKNLSSRISSLDEQVVKQQELLYNVEFQLQQMERKVARAGGVRSDEEVRALNARISKLTGVLEKVNAEHSMLLEQVKHSEEDLLHVQRANAALKADRAKIDESIRTLKLEVEMAVRQVKGAVTDKEKALVDHDVMKLDVRRLRDILAMHADEVFSLENRKYQLKMSAQERTHEVEVHRDGLRAELRLLRDDIHRLMLELRERSIKVEKLQAKFEVVSTKHHGGPDDVGPDGQPHSQAYYVIRAAQEREELQREGDELDAKIRKAEKEVAALEATLLQCVGSNGQYASSFVKVDSSSAFKERAVLRERLDRVYDKLKFKRQEEAVLAADCAQLSSRLASLTAGQRGLTAVTEDLARRKDEAERQADEQAEKLARARRASARAAQALGLPPPGTPPPPGGAAPLAKEATLAEMREVTRAMLAELAQLAAANPDVRIGSMAAAAGVRLPTPSGLAASGGQLRTPPSSAGSRTSQPGPPGQQESSRPPSARSQGSMRGSQGSIRGSQGSVRGSSVMAGRAGGGSRPGSGPGVGVAVRPVELGL